MARWLDARQAERETGERKHIVTQAAAWARMTEDDRVEAIRLWRGDEVADRYAALGRAE